MDQIPSICFFCETVNSLTARFCTHCGENLQADNNAPAQPALNNQSKPAPQAFIHEARRKKALDYKKTDIDVMIPSFDALLFQQDKESPTAGMSASVIIGVILLVIIAIGSIVAAIIIPAYKNHTTKEKVFDVYSQTASLKSKITAHATQTGFWPINFEQMSVKSLDLENKNYHILLLSEGVLEVYYAWPENIAGGRLQLRPTLSSPGHYTWQCQSFEMKKSHLPSECKPSNNL